MTSDKQTFLVHKILLRTLYTVGSVATDEQNQ